MFANIETNGNNISVSTWVLHSACTSMTELNCDCLHVTSQRWRHFCFARTQFFYGGSESEFSSWFFYFTGFSHVENMFLLVIFMKIYLRYSKTQFWGSFLVTIPLTLSWTYLLWKAICSLRIKYIQNQECKYFRLS